MVSESDILLSSDSREKRPPMLRPLAKSAFAPHTLSLKRVPQLGPKPREEAYAPGAFLRSACPKLVEEAYAPCAFHEALSCEAPNAANVDGRTWAGCVS